MSKDCYKNKTCEKCNKKGHTKEVCRENRKIIIGNVEYDNSSEESEISDSEEEIVKTPGILVTTRSGQKYFKEKGNTFRNKPNNKTTDE